MVVAHVTDAHSARSIVLLFRPTTSAVWMGEPMVVLRGGWGSCSQLFLQGQFVPKYVRTYLRMWEIPSKG